MDSRDKSEFDLIMELEEDAAVSQHKLSKKLGIAAGLVNILMKRAVNRGFIKMKQIPARRYAYYLTPKGFAEKKMELIRCYDYEMVPFSHPRSEKSISARDTYRGTSVGIECAEAFIEARRIIF